MDSFQIEIARDVQEALCSIHNKDELHEVSKKIVGMKKMRCESQLSYIAKQFAWGKVKPSNSFNNTVIVTGVFWWLLCVHMASHPDWHTGLLFSIIISGALSVVSYFGNVASDESPSESMVLYLTTLIFGYGLAVMGYSFNKVITLPATTALTMYFVPVSILTTMAISRKAYVLRKIEQEEKLEDKGASPLIRFYNNLLRTHTSYLEDFLKDVQTLMGHVDDAMKDVISYQEEEDEESELQLQLLKQSYQKLEAAESRTEEYIAKAEEWVESIKSYLRGIGREYVLDKARRLVEETNVLLDKEQEVVRRQLRFDGVIQDTFDVVAEMRAIDATNMEAKLQAKIELINQKTSS